MLIARLTGFEGEINWDATRSDGQPRVNGKLNKVVMRIIFGENIYPK